MNTSTLSKIGKSVFLSALILTCPCINSLAQTGNSPTPTISAASIAPASLSGWDGGLTVEGQLFTYSSPNIADVDGDATNGKEIVVGGSDGRVYAYHADGSLLWSVLVPNAQCSPNQGRKIFSSAAVGNLYGDGAAYVVIGYGGVGSKDCDGGVIALKGSDGSTAWKFSVKKFSEQQKFWAFRYSVLSSPGLADVDNDGKLEVGFGALDRNVYLLNSDGTPRWYYIAGDTVWSSPTFADANGDGKLEMIIGTDISANAALKPPTKNGGYVYAFKTDARNGYKINFRDKSAFLWQRYLSQVVFSSPVVADVLPNKEGLEVVVGSGCFFPQKSNEKNGKWLRVLRLKDGKILRTLHASGCLSSSPAIADIDADGILEVVATVNANKGAHGDKLGHIMAWKANNQTAMWSTAPRDKDKNDTSIGEFKSPIVADIDGNGSLEVVAANSSRISILRAADGVQLTCQKSDCSDNPLLLKTGRTVQSTPAIGDLNNDGILDLVATSGRSNSSSGAIYVWTNFSEVLSSPATEQAPYAAPWPMARGNPAHTGVYTNDNE